MPFTTTLKKAVMAAHETEVDGYILTDDEWDDEHGLRVDLSDYSGEAVYKFDESQRIEINDDGEAKVIDIDGKEHEFVFERLRPLCEADCQD